MGFDQREPGPSDLGRQRQCDRVIVRVGRVSSQSFRFDPRLDLSPKVDLIRRVQARGVHGSVFARAEGAADVHDAIDVGQKVGGFASHKGAGGTQALQGGRQREIAAQCLIDLLI